MLERGTILLEAYHDGKFMSQRTCLALHVKHPFLLRVCGFLVRGDVGPGMEGSCEGSLSPFSSSS